MLPRGILPQICKSRCVFVAQCCWENRRRVLFSTYLGCHGQGRICVIYVMTSAARIGQRESVSSDTWMKIVIAGVRRSDFDDIWVFNPKITRRRYGSRCFLSRVPRRIRNDINRMVISQLVIPKRVRNSFPALEGCGESWEGRHFELVGLRMQRLFVLLWIFSFSGQWNDQSIFGQTYLERNKHHSFKYRLELKYILFEPAFRNREEYV